MVDGWVQADVDVNPLLGPQVLDIALKLANGEQVEKEQLTNESVFYPDKAAELLPTRQYEAPNRCAAVTGKLVAHS